MEENEDKNSKNKNSTKTLTFWVSIICLLILITQLVLNLCGVQYEIKIFIEIISYILAFMVSIGLLNSNLKGKNITEIKEDIQSDIENKINKDKNIQE